MQFFSRLATLAFVSLFLGCVTGNVKAVSEENQAKALYLARAPDRLFSDARRKVFKVIIDTPLGQGGGTAFLLKGPRGNVVLTNKHICESYLKAPLAYMSLNQGDYSWYVKMDRMATDTDLCLIKLPEDLTNANAYELSKRRPQYEERVFVYGHPFLEPLTQTYGAYKHEFVLPSDPGDEKYDLSGILAGRLRFMVRPGNSGSPVLNKDGEVVGIVFAYDHIGALMIPLSSIKEFLDGN